jgi:hypothetical protein
MAVTCGFTELRHHAGHEPAGQRGCDVSEGDLNSGPAHGTGIHQRASDLAIVVPPRAAGTAAAASGYTRNPRRQHHTEHHRRPRRQLTHARLEAGRRMCANATTALDPIPRTRGGDHAGHDPTRAHRGAGGPGPPLRAVREAARRPVPGEARSRPPRRFLDAYVAGKLSRAYLAAVVGELVVIDRAVMIPARAA